LQALRANSISTPQAQPNNQQALPGAGVATGPSLPQHLVHPYSQPTLPLGHFANMISYPFMPQSYTYMPSAFQQAFAGNSTYHQSLAAVLPQYKNSVSVSSLPQSASIPSGYGFGSSTSIPGGNYPLNQPAAPTSSTIGYDDVISSQYKDNNHMISLQQQVDYFFKMPLTVFRFPWYASSLSSRVSLASLFQCNHCVIYVLWLIILK
jgi:hypothetical protein